MDSWRTWQRVVPTLERHHEVFAPALPGHTGGPPLGEADLVDRVEALVDEAGFGSAHIAGNSLGGWLALQLAMRGRARSVVALAPAGGWAEGDSAPQALFEYQRSLRQMVRASAPHADAIASNSEEIPPELVAHQIMAVATCPEADAFLDRALVADWAVDPESIECPVRIVWGTADDLLPWPAAAARFQAALPHADWEELDGVGHYPQLEAPVETAQLILGVTGG